ncbi:ATP-binding protein [Methylophaga thiooxydans]|nr:ATP-binding protein [Methylophaga thiooxydans]
MINTIELAYSNGEKAILISGDEGMGKTVLLSQFLEKNKSKSFSLFLDVTNKQSYFEQNLVRDIYRQVHFKLNGKDCHNFETINQADLISLFYSLQVALQKYQTEAFFIVDGLDDIPPEDDYIVESLMSVMPLSDKNIKFLFSTKSKSLEKYLSNVNFKTVEMMLYSHPEAMSALPKLSATEVEEVLSVYRGIPERIEQVRRLIESGLTVEDVITIHSESNESLLKAEWQSIGELDQIKSEILPLIAFSECSLSLSDLSEITGLESEKIIATLQSITFLDSSSPVIKFFSNAMRDFVRKQLSNEKSQSLRKIIAYWSAHPNDASAITEITSHSHILGDYSSVVEQLSNSNILTIFNETNSVNGVSRQVKHGLNAASELNSELDVFRFAHVHSFMTGMKTSRLLESELLCHLNQNDYESALGLAIASRVLEERLHLLATIATHQKQKKDSVDEGLKKRIMEDFSNINSEYLGVDRTIELASRLFTAFPEEALSLINGVDSLERGGGNKADYAFFRFSLEALKNASGDVDKIIQGIEIKEDKKRNALNILGLFKKGTPPEKIISSLSGFDKPGDAIYVLRSWINAFPESDGIYLLVKKLISLVISTTDYHANASLYADISTSLNHMRKPQGVEILNKISPRLDDLKSFGPTVDYVRLQCNILKFEIKHGLLKNRDIELYKFISECIEDASIKLSSLTLLYVQFNELQEKTNINLNTVKDLKENVFEQIIGNTADQYTALKDALLNELQVSYDNAISWAKRLNNQRAIDKAIAMVIHEACDLEVELQISKVEQHIRNIKDKDYKADTTIHLFEHLSESGIQISKADFHRLVKLRNRIKDHLSNTQINSCLLEIMKKSSLQLAEKRATIITSLEESWDGLDGNWQKIDVAFDIHNKLFKTEPEVALSYKDRAIDLRTSENAVSASEMYARAYSIDLAIRSLFQLCKFNLQSNKDLTNIVELISTVPGKNVRIRLFSRLASALQLTDHLNEFQRIVESFLLPEIDSLGDGYSHELSVAIVLCGPILFSYSQEIFTRKLDYIAQDVDRYDKALYHTHKYLITKNLIHDPYEPVKKNKFKLSAVDLEKHLFVVKKIRKDTMVYGVLWAIVKRISLGKKNNEFSKPQLSNFASELDNIIGSAFMKDGDIQHEGYKICCEALRLSILGEKSKVIWGRLTERARRIPIHSDKVIVLGEIIEFMPSSMADFKKSLLDEAVTVVYGVVSNLEQISRFEYLAQQGQDLDKSRVKRFIKDAVLLSTSEDTNDFHEKRLSLIDSVDSMDKEFASGLSALFDDDPARKKIIEKNIQQKQKERETKDQFSISSDEIIKHSTSSKYPSHIWGLLGKMNAANHIPDKKADYIKYIYSISDYKPVDAYPMLSYYINALSFTTSNKQMVSSTFRPIFDVIIQDNQLFASLFETQANIPAKQSQTQSQIVFSPNQSEAVLDFFSQWISKDEKEEILIVDPYFTHEDLDFVGTVIRKDPNFMIRILTSYANIKKMTNNTDDDVAEVIRKYWNENIISDVIPDIDVTFCGLSSIGNIMPIHDRWWLASTSGLRLGGSINGVMGKRISEISEMQHDEVLNVEEKIKGYVNATQRMHNDERLKYMRVSI